MMDIVKNKRTFKIQYLEHMLHHVNIEGVLTYGLLSHNGAYTRGLIKEDISMSEVQTRRKRKNIKVGDLSVGLHDLVSFYFNTKNPMLYVRKSVQDDLLIILIDTEILDCKSTDSRFAIFTDGNAGSESTKFFIGKPKLENVDFELIFSGSWNSDDEELKRENKRKMCSEVLIYPSVPVTDIKKIICPNKKMYDYVITTKDKIGYVAAHIVIEINRKYYF